MTYQARTFASSVALMAATLPVGAYADTQKESAAREARMMQIIELQERRIHNLEDRLAKLEKPASDRIETAVAATAEKKAAAPTNRAPAPPMDLAINWGNGAPVVSRADGSFIFKPRGRILFDVDGTFGSQLPSRNITTTGLRAGRLGAEGTFHQHGFYQFEADFAEGELGLVGAFVGYQNRLGKLEYDLRVGNMYNDRSLEGQTGSLTTPFIERNFVANAIIPQKGFYGLGTMLRVYGPNWHASINLSGDRIDGDYSTDDTLSIASRVHWNPLKTENAIVHLGVWGFHEELSDSARTITRNTAIGARFDTALRVSTGPLTGANNTVGYGAEVAGLYRNTYVWAEYGRRDMHFLPSSPINDFASDAWSIAAGWFLTGEKPPYSGRQGNFLPLKILRMSNGGFGAVELVARHERLDYSRVPLGGTGEETTVGLNWYPVPLLRFMVNWSHWNINNRVSPLVGADDGDSITTRAQFNF